MRSLSLVVAMLLGATFAWAVNNSDIYQAVALSHATAITLSKSGSDWVVRGDFCVPVEAGNAGFAAVECKSHAFTASAAAKTRIETLVTTDVIPAFATQHGYRTAP